jgi:hypothetical protein
MSKFVKDDQARVHATKINGIIDELGLQFSERWARDGNGEWWYGKISFVFKKKSRSPQKYRILYHDGTTVGSLEEDIEMAPDETDDGDTESEEDERDRCERELQVDDREEDEDYNYEETDDIEEDEDGEVVKVRISARARQRKIQVEVNTEQNWTTEMEESDEDKDDDDTAAVGECCIH